MRRLSLPKTRGDCAGKRRPCPHIQCRYHLILDGSVTRGIPELEDLEQTCSLDVADAGEHSLEDIGTILGLTRERVRQIEEKAKEKLNKILLRLERGIKPIEFGERVADLSDAPKPAKRRKRRKKRKRRASKKPGVVVKLNGKVVGKGDVEKLVCA